jgi:SpoVK/Ycf46/Vps4 family AAA+-type ATPase
MRLPVSLDSSKRTCFIALPNVAIRALFGQRRPAGVVALKMKWGGKVAFVSFAGHISSRAFVEVPTAFSHTIGLADDIQAAGDAPLFVILNKVDYAPKIHSITLDPVSEDDWEIIERNAGFLENSLLDQISTVYNGLIFPIWIEGQMLVRLKATLNSPNSCELLARDSEVIIAPRVRKKKRSEQQKVLAKPDHVENIGKKRNIIELKVLPCDNEKYAGPAICDGWRGNTQAYLNPKTLDRVAGDSDNKEDSEYNDEKNCSKIRKDNNGTGKGKSWGGRYKPLLGSILAVSGAENIDEIRNKDNHTGFTKQYGDTIVLLFPDESVPEDYISIPWATRIRCKLEIFKVIKVATLISTIPKKASNKVDIFLHPIHFELENKDIILSKEATDVKRSKEMIHDKGNNNGNDNSTPPILDQLTDTSSILLAGKLSNAYNLNASTVIDSFWNSVNDMEDKQKLYVDDDNNYTYGGGLILSHGSIIVLKVKAGFAPQAFQVGLMIKKTNDFGNNTLQSAWNDAFESAGGRHAEKRGCVNRVGQHGNDIEEKNVWRIICSKKSYEENRSLLPNVQLGIATKIKVPTHIICDSFYSGTSPSHIGARDEILNKAWLQLAPRIVPEAIAIRNMLGTPPPGHLLITGGNATGKTTFVSALAWKFRHDRSCLARTIKIKCRSLVGKKTLDVRNAIKKALDDATQKRPSLVIFDDIDALMPVSEGGEPENVQASRLAEDLSDMLIELSRIMEQKMQQPKSNPYEHDNMGGVAIVVTAKRKGALHPSLQRCGIIDTALALDPPDARGRGDIIDALLDKTLIENGYETSHNVIQNNHQYVEDDHAHINGEEIDTLELGSLTEGYMPGDLCLLVKRARLIASLERVKAHNKNIESTNCFLGLDYLKKHNVLPRQEHFDEAMVGYKPAALKSVKLFTSDVQWSDVGGLDTIRHTLKDTLQLPTLFAPLFSRAPIKLPSGVCLFGPPGCGKTLLAGAVANECGLNFISVKGPEILNKYIGGSEENVRNLFARAAAAAPSILFFDEFDSVAPRRGADSTGVTDRVVNQLLTFLDGVEDRNGVYVMAATSRPDMIDPALLRPGRLDKSLYCGFPDEKERQSIFETIATKMGLPREVFKIFPRLAQRYPLFTGADIQAALYTAQLSSIHESTPSMEDLRKLEIEDHRMMPRKENIVTTKHVVDACNAARPSVSLQDRRMYNKIYQKYLSDRGQDQKSPKEMNTDISDKEVRFGYDVKKQRTALA